MIPPFLIAGKKLFGRVDQVAGLSYVATEFVHIFFIPLIPLTSYVVRDGTENIAGFRGTEIKMNLKSVLAAYLRAFFILAALYQIYRMVRFGSYHPIPILKCAAFIAMYFLSRKLFRARYEQEMIAASQADAQQRLAEQRNAQTKAAEGSGTQAAAAVSPRIQCSFCDRFPEQVLKVITGMSAYICNDCVTYLAQSSNTEYVAKQQGLVCNFCHQQSPETMAMAHRQDKWICGECLSVCVEIITTEPQKSTA